jgi:hypothetical protein
MKGELDVVIEKTHFKMPMAWSPDMPIASRRKNRPDQQFKAG